MKRHLSFVAAVLAVWSAPARAYDFCVPTGTKVRADVQFAAGWENSVKILDKSGRRLRTFNNYFGRGAGSDWDQGAGSWEIVATPEQRCFRIASEHKAGEPDPAKPWVANKLRTAMSPGHIRLGYEDGGDASYNDATVTLRTTEPPGLGVEGNRVCATGMRQLSFAVSFGAFWENGIRIIREDNGRLIQSFNNYFGMGAGSDWDQGPGFHVTNVPLTKTCFRIEGTHKSSEPNPAMPWNPSKHRSDGNQVGFVDGGGTDYTNAVVSISGRR